MPNQKESKIINEPYINEFQVHGLLHGSAG